MGYRIVEFALDDPTDEGSHEYLRQLSAFAAWHGCQPSFESSGRPDEHGLVRFELDGNSSWLDDFTPLFIDGCEEIARDMGDIGDNLRNIADEIKEQLTNQLVPKTGGFITTPRLGREGMELAWGEPSPTAYISELQIHAGRLRQSLEDHRLVSGPEGWRQRIDVRRLAIIDSEAIVRTARRLVRSMERLNERLPTDHLHAVVGDYLADLAGLVALRDMAEHLDEYAVGRGRADTLGEEPGLVFDYEFTDDVIVVARGHRLSALEVVSRSEGMAQCIDASLAAHWFRITHPDGWDFDFVTQRPDGSFVVVPREAEDPVQRDFRAIAKPVGRATVSTSSRATTCPRCGRAC